MAYTISLEHFTVLTGLANLHKLFNECKQLIGANRDHRFSIIVLEVCSKRLFFSSTYVQVITPVLNLSSGLLRFSKFSVPTIAFLAF